MSFLVVAEKGSRFKTATVCLILCLIKMSSHFTNTNFNVKYSNYERGNGTPFDFIDKDKQNKIIDKIEDLPNQPKIDEKDNNTNKKVAEKGEEITLSQTPIQTIYNINKNNGKKSSTNNNLQLCTYFSGPVDISSELDVNNKDTACKPNFRKIAFHYAIIHYAKERWIITVLDFEGGEFGLGYAKKLSFHSAIVNTTGGLMSFFGICGQLITYLQFSTKNRPM